MKELLNLYEIIIILLYRKIDITQEILDKNKNKCLNIKYSTKSEFISWLEKEKESLEHQIMYYLSRLSSGVIDTQYCTKIHDHLANILYDIEKHPYRPRYIQDI